MIVLVKGDCNFEFSNRGRESKILSPYIILNESELFLIFFIIHQSSNVPFVRWVVYILISWLYAPESNLYKHLDPSFSLSFFFELINKFSGMFFHWIHRFVVALFFLSRSRIPDLFGCGVLRRFLVLVFCVRMSFFLVWFVS